MKFNYLALLSIISLLSLGEATVLRPLTALAGPAKTSFQLQGASGSFISSDNKTQGNARIVTQNGQRYLELGTEFNTGEAPDLYVLLHRSATPNSYKPSEYINLGRLEKLSGTQRYAIPNTANLSDYQSAVIWCRQFDVTMAHASFGGKKVADKPNPCAAKPNPCASKPNPCAAKPNPCASKTNPCAAKTNPCASKPNPCAAKTNPCAGK